MRYINARNTAYGEDRRTYKQGTNANTTDTVFNVSYDNGRVEAYLNGVRLFPGDDYTKTSSGIGTSITLESQLGASNVIEVVGYQGVNQGNAFQEDVFIVGTGSTGSGGSYTNSTTVFPVSSSNGDSVSVFRNGIKLVGTTDYVVSASASTVTLQSAASSADKITVQVVGILNHVNVVPNQSSQSGKFLTTNGSTSSWSDLVFPAGHILQVVQVVKTDTQDMTASGSVNWTAVTGMEASLTPSSSSNKILVKVSLTVGSDPYCVFCKLQAKTGSGSYADLTAAMGDADNSRSRIMMSALGGTADASELSTMTMEFLDSPSTTSQRYYQPWFTPRNSGSAHINRGNSDTNHDYSGRSISTITLMEVAG